MTSASRAPVPMRFPILTVVTLTLTAATTATRFRGPGAVHALRRDPTALRSGQVWRLLSPVLVQTDRSAVVVIATFVLCAAIGVFGEQVFRVRSGSRCTSSAHSSATASARRSNLVKAGRRSRSPPSSAASLRMPSNPARGCRSRCGSKPSLAIPLAILDTAFRDIHGLPFLAGLAITAIWCRRAAERAPHHRAGVARGVSMTPE